jgi:hypothetical protein
MAQTGSDIKQIWWRQRADDPEARPDKIVVYAKDDGKLYARLPNGDILEVATGDVATFPIAAADVDYTPAGAVAATDVQAAITELDTEKAAAGHTHAAPTESINFIIDGGGSAITTGVKGDVRIDFACTVVAWTILADQSGSIVVDIWKDTLANFPPTGADSMTTSEKPTLSAADDNTDTSLNGGNGWAIAAGDILRFNVDSAATVTRVTVALKITRS